jgi:hypothetical protein
MNVIDLKSGENWASGWLDHVSVSKGAGVYRFRGDPTGEAVYSESLRFSSTRTATRAFPSADTLSRTKLLSNGKTTSGSPPNTGTEKRV